MDEKFFSICKFNLPYQGKSQSSRITRAFDDLNDTWYETQIWIKKYSGPFFNRLIIKSLIFGDKKSLDLSRFIQNIGRITLLFLDDIFFFQQQEKKFSSEACSLYRWMDREFQFSKPVDDWFSEWLVAETLLCCTCIKFMKTGMNPSEIVFPGKATLEFIKFTPFRIPFHQTDVTLLR